MQLDEVFGFPKPTGGERARYLIIVARDQSDLWQHLRRTFGGIDGVEVLLDRRHGGWWQFTQSREYQERGTDRRRPANLETAVRYNAFQVVPRQVPVSRG
jgi:hypothetical protein